MWKKYYVAVALAFFSILPGLISCKKQMPAWGGTIHNVDGVTVVKNPKKPILEKDACSIEEELSIGSLEKGEKYIFSEIVDVDVDGEENIYILDFQEAHIVVFDKAGGHLRTIGRKGQGPGEMQGPYNIYITPAGEILINDRGARYLHFFGRNGQHLRSISLARMSLSSFHRPNVDTQNNIVARTMTSTRGPTAAGDVSFLFILEKFDAKLDERFRIFSYEYLLLPDVRNVYPPECFWAVNNEDNIIWGYSDKYELQVLDENGHVIRRIFREYDPVKITEEEKREWARSSYGDKGVPAAVRVNWPSHHNAFHSLDVDDSGRLFVQTYEKGVDGNGYYYDIFDPEGRCIAQVLLKAAPRAIKNGKLYTIEEDDMGFHVVKRYKMAWKDVR